MRLTDVQIRLAEPREKGYSLNDGADGLYLWIAPTGHKAWRRDYTLKGRRATHTLGVYLPAGAAAGEKPRMSLREARLAAEDSRRQVAAGIDPNQQRRRLADEAAAAARQAAEVLQAQRETDRARKATQAARRAQERATVQRVADAWVEASESGWTVEHAAQVRQSLEDHVHPKIGKKPIAEITTDDVLDVLTTLLKAGKVETASRVYQRLSAIWEWAQLKKQAAADPVAPLKREFGRLKKLARRNNPKRNFAAVDRAELPALLRAMTAYRGDTVTRLAIRLLALTFVRTGELRLAQWPEFELDGAEPTWTIPVERMKVKLRGDRQAEPHGVPLARQAVDVLKDLKRVTGGRGWVLPQSRKRDKPISENAILYALGGMGFASRMTGHGFRAVASTLLHEAGWPHDAIEAQLAHEKADATSAAYDRGQRLEVRRRMMQAYADLLDEIEKDRPAEVVQLRRAAS